jgi:3-oxoacyl-[acyl-carrier-protein] synthase-3
MKSVAIRDIAVAVPPTRRDQSAWVNGVAEKLIAATGIRERRVVDRETMTDLFEAAAKQALGHRRAIDGLVVVTQTPDQRIPPIANVLHGRLGLPQSCVAFDVNQGCSGYVYGLQVAGSLVHAGLRRVLLLAGDCLSTVVRPYDRATEPLFGDAASATYLERDEDAPYLCIGCGSDGAGASHLSLAHGDTAGLRMNGAAVFEFASAAVPPLIEQTLEQAGLTLDDIDAVVPHQPNATMLEHLRQKCRVPKEKWVDGVVEHYGNVSSASIPLAIVLSGRRGRLLLVGFGGGWSFGAAIADLSETRLHPLVEAGK